MATKTAAVKASGKKRAAKPKSLRQLFTSSRRWMQGDMNDGRGRYCLLGGLDRVYVYGSASYFAAKERLLNAIGPEYEGVVSYNDSLTRTFTDIKRIVRKARV